MKKILFGALMAGVVTAGVLFASGQDTDSGVDFRPAVAVNQTLKADVVGSLDDFAPVAKKCNFQSDCKYGKCKRGRCGACDFQSDCRGWGKCKRGRCGACDFQSDCKKKGFGSCRSGRCTKSPY